MKRALLPKQIQIVENINLMPKQILKLILIVIFSGLRTIFGPDMFSISHTTINTLGESKLSFYLSGSIILLFFTFNLLYSLTFTAENDTIRTQLFDYLEGRRRFIEQD